MTEDDDLPLSPYRVLDLTEGGFNLGAKILGDLGADVIRIEKPGGSPTRSQGPFFGDDVHPEKSLFWFAFNLNKRGITLSLDTEDGKDIFRKLAATSDIVLESLGPHRMEEKGVGYDALADGHPQVIHASITPFGHEGPYAHFQATDMTLWAMSGLQYASGDSDRPPVRITVPTAEAVTGAQAASGSMHALWHRINTGEGQQVDVTGQIATVTANMAISAYATAGTPIKREGEYRDVGYTRSRVLYPCKDGYVSIFVMQGKWGAAFNSRLAAWMTDEGQAPDYFEGLDWKDWTPGVKHIKGDPKGAKEDIRKVEEPLARFFLTKTKAEIFQRALDGEMLLAPVLTTADMYEWEHLAGRKFWKDVYHDHLDSTLRYPGAFILMSGTPIEFRRRPPLIGEHNQEILGDELGYSSEQMAVLRAEGTI